jgi:hypothetical protein
VRRDPHRIFGKCQYIGVSSGRQATVDHYSARLEFLGVFDSDR